MIGHDEIDLRGTTERHFGLVAKASDTTPTKTERQRKLYITYEIVCHCRMH